MSSCPEARAARRAWRCSSPSSEGCGADISPVGNHGHFLDSLGRATARSSSSPAAVGSEVRFEDEVLGSYHSLASALDNLLSGQVDWP